MRWWCALLTLAAAQAAPTAAPARKPAPTWLLPPIDGRVGGEVNVTKIAGSPKLRFEVTSRTAGERRFAHVAVDGAGTRLRLALDVDAQGNGTWVIHDARLDAAIWYPPFAPALGKALSAATAEGEFELSGRGAVHAGQPAGAVRLVWRGGVVRDPTAGWSFDGVTLEGEFALDLADGTMASVSPFQLVVRTITTQRLGARNLTVRGRLNADRSVELEQARIEIAGGEIAIEPCTIPLAPPSIHTSIRVTRVGLQDVAALVPAQLAETRGRVSGRAGFGWTEAEGVQLGAGELTLDPSEPAVVRLSPAPGFLTSRVPEFISLLPGALGRWFRPRNPAFDDVQRIELGRTGLAVQSLGIRLTPDGDDRGRTASVRIVGRPENPDGVVKEVTFEVNVAGPLSAVLRMGMQQKFTVGVR